MYPKEQNPPEVKTSEGTVYFKYTLLKKYENRTKRTVLRSLFTLSLEKRGRDR